MRVNRILEEKLTVAEASSNFVDDNIYAAIEWVQANGGHQFILHGQRYGHCLELKEVKVVSNKKNTLSILPIMKQVSEFCPMKGMPVRYPVKLDLSSLNISHPLLHVRTLDGKSVNSVFKLEEKR